MFNITVSAPDCTSINQGLMSAHCNTTQTCSPLWPALFLQMLHSIYNQSSGPNQGNDLSSAHAASSCFKRWGQKKKKTLMTFLLLSRFRGGLHLKLFFYFIVSNSTLCDVYGVAEVLNDVQHFYKTRPSQSKKCSQAPLASQIKPQLMSQI